MKDWPDGCIDLTVTSPPYDNLRDYKGYVFDFEPIAQQLYRVTKDGGVVVWVVGDQSINGSETGTSFRQALYFKEIGFNLHDTMLYLKENPTPLNHNRYEQGFEYMFALSKGSPRTFNPMKIPCLNPGKLERYSESRRRNFGPNHAMRRYTCVQYRVTSKSKICPNVFIYKLGLERPGHPGPFPGPLARDQILSWSNESDLVLDPFVGSGTTCVQATLWNRNYLGIDISQEYCDLAKQRIQESIAQQQLFQPLPGSGPTWR
jgi:site-specific DNA-methyltransferase (adenine-specific)